MKILRYFTTCALLFLAASCASSYAPRVGTTFQPGQNTAVVFGKLTYTDNTKIEDDSSSKYRMALLLANDDTKKPLYVRFSKTEPISCASIPGGHYTLTGFVATDSSDHVLGGKVFGPEDKIDIRVAAEPNTAIYLGDFSGYVKYYVYGALTTVETGLKQVTNNFSASTASFHGQYPNLAALPVRSAFGNAGK